MTKHSWLVFFGIVALLVGAGAFVFPQVFATRYQDMDSDTQLLDSSQETDSVTSGEQTEAVTREEEAPLSSATHIATPKEVKAVYMTSWVASTPSLRKKLIEFIESNEINAVVLDIKDDTGRVSFLLDDPLVAKTGSPVNRIKDIDALIEDLHKKNVYVIGRISVFQDPYLTSQYPAWAIHRKSDGAIWKDRKGLSFLDPTSHDVWEYIAALAKASYAKGFDEINFDYMRFPSDGIISDIAYPNEVGKTRADFLEDFFAFLGKEMKDSGIPSSIDLFGMVTTAQDDLGIGQVLSRALPHFDWIAPMVYPSHYPTNFIGIKNPAAEPYRVVHYAMQSAVTRAQALGYGPEKFRTWIQDFNLGATYTASMVRDQIRASEELGITSWMVWDPANTYTVGAFDSR